MEKQLLAILDNEISRKQYRYLLIDNLAAISELDLIYLDNIKNMLGEKSIVTVKRPDLVHDLTLCPKLITIGKPHRIIEDRLVRFSLVQALDELNHDKRYVCSWIVSEYPPVIIAEQFIQIGKILAERCSMKYIPFYEPFRMQLLDDSNQISQEWLPTVLGFCSHYVYISVFSELKIINKLGENSSDTEIFMAEQTKFNQKESKNIFKLLNAWMTYCEEADKPFSDINMMDITNAYQYAYEQGLVDLKDKMIFALMSLKYGDLMTNSILSEAVQEAQQDPGTLIDHFKQINLQEFSSLTIPNYTDTVL